MRKSAHLLAFCAFAVFLWAGNVLALNATDTIQAELFSGQSGITTEPCKMGGLDVTSIHNGDYISFNNVDFGTGGIQCFEASIASYGSGGFIEVRLDSPTGTLAATCETRPSTGSWQNWNSRTCRLSGITGVHAVYLVFTGAAGTDPLFSIDWFKFHGSPSFTSAGWRVSSKAGKGHWNGSLPLAAAGGSANITVFPDTFYQRVEGHGGAFNDNGWHCIDTANKLSPGLGNSIVKALFDPVNGLRLNMGRVPIGMSDFTTTKNYSLDEIPSGVSDTTDYTLKYFTLGHDSLFNMRYCRMAQQYQPNLLVYATPWTPPSWMKTNKNWQGTNSATMDTIAPKLTTYATYFRRMVQGWQNYGIPIFVVCPQNEPTYITGSHPSCKWPGTGTSMRNFCRDFLWPEFQNNGIGTEIWMGTFYENGYATDIGPTLSDPLARTRITGCGLQRGGAAQCKQCIDTSDKYGLHWHAIQTENWCQSGLNNWYDAMNTFSALFDFWGKNTNSFNFWNMVLDSNYGYVTWMGRSQNAMVIVNPRAKPLPTVMYTGEYYTMKHFSYYVAIGATRVKTNTSGSGLTSCAFKNPDGSIIVEVMNVNKTSTSAVIQIGSQSFTATLPDSSANTFILGGNPDTREWTPGIDGVQYTPSTRTAVAARAGIIGVYDVKGRLIRVLNRTSPAKRSGMLWDRTDAGGRKVAPGLYIIRDLSGKDVRIQKVMCQ